MNVLAALGDYYAQLRSRGEAPPYGYSRERIAFAVVVSGAGEPVTVSPLFNGSAKPVPSNGATGTPTRC